MQVADRALHIGIGLRANGMFDNLQAAAALARIGFGAVSEEENVAVVLMHADPEKLLGIFNSKAYTARLRKVLNETTHKRAG